MVYIHKSFSVHLSAISSIRPDDLAIYKMSTFIGEFLFHTVYNKSATEPTARVVEL